MNSSNEMASTQVLERLSRDGIVVLPALVPPDVLAGMQQCFSAAFQLCEAKGWLFLPTRKDFHGWHSDMWYE